MSERPLSDAFNDCIDRINTGQSVADCLRAHPHHAAALRPMLEAGLLVRRLLPPTAEVVQAQERARFHIARTAAAARAPRPVVSRVLSLAASLIFALFVAGTAYAALRQITAPLPPTVPLTPPTALSPAASRTPTTAPSPEPSPTPTATASPTATPTASSTPLVNAAAERSALPAPTPTATRDDGCAAPVPDGWVRYNVRPGDTLSALALATGTTTETLTLTNCLTQSLILVGQALYLPVIPPTRPPSAPAASAEPPPASADAQAGGFAPDVPAGGNAPAASSADSDQPGSDERDDSASENQGEAEDSDEEDGADDDASGEDDSGGDDDDGADDDSGGEDDDDDSDDSDDS